MLESKPGADHPFGDLGSGVIQHELRTGAVGFSRDSGQGLIAESSISTYAFEPLVVQNLTSLSIYFG